MKNFFIAADNFDFQILNSICNYLGYISCLFQIYGNLLTNLFLQSFRILIYDGFLLLYRIPSLSFSDFTNLLFHSLEQAAFLQFL